MSIVNMINSKMSDAARDSVPVFYNEKLAVFKPKSTVKKETFFDCFHFAIPSWSFNPELIVDKKIYYVLNNRVFPTNPGQVLSCTQQKEVKDYTAIFMDRQFLEDTCGQMYGKSNISFVNNSYTLSSYGFSIIRQFVDEYRAKQIGYEFILDSLSVQIAVTLIREIENNASSEVLDGRYGDKANICKAAAFLKEYYNSSFTLEDVAKVANLSPYHFIKVFKTETGKTPFDYLMDIKIEKSRQMLKSNRYSIAEISSLCGFINASHFSTVFKKKVGVSPSEFRKKTL